MPGSIKSRMINEGGSFSLSAAVSPASPVAATIARKFSRSRLYFKLSEMSGSSSMIRTGWNIVSNEMSDVEHQISGLRSASAIRHLTSHLVFIVFNKGRLSHIDRQLADVCNIIDRKSTRMNSSH